MEVIAHRGASHDAPENTVAAARLAWAEGADALEFDVHLTRDRQLAVVHDADLQRVAGTPLRVSAATLAELRRHDVGQWKHPRYAGEKIPTLDEMLATVPPGKRVFIELKDGGPAAVEALAQSLARPDAPKPAQVVVIAFDLTIAHIAKLAQPDWEVCWIVDHETAPDALSLREIIAKVDGLDGVDFDATWSIEAEIVRRCHDAGLKLYVWTVDDLATARRLAEAGVDGITTNRPGWLRHALNSGAS
jgi:glycerophosphoryl diester phosphodiesterase